MSNNIILSIDVASLRPSYCLAQEDNNTINILETFDLEEARDPQGRYEVALYSNFIDRTLAQYNFKLSDIKTFIYINGPGPFSSLRWVSVLTKLLFRLNNNINIYTLSQNEAYYRYYLNQELINSQDNILIAVKAGIRGYFVEEYQNNIITQKANMLNNKQYQELTQTEKNIIQIQEDNQEINTKLISPILLNILQRDNLSEYKINSLEEIIPNYLRDANITMRREVPDRTS